MHFPVIGECLGWRTRDFEELYGDLGQWTMAKELAREVSGFYLSSYCEVWWIAESVLNMSRSRADGTMSSWLLYFRNFTNFHTVSYTIWTPLWTKCASTAAILSNISADENLGVFQDSKFLTEREILLTARTTRELCGLELETWSITHQTWFCVSVCSKVNMSCP